MTGIPYYADWRSADYSDWIYSNVSDDGSRLSYKRSSNACIVSPAFHFPTSLSINSQIAATTNGTSVSDANKMYVSTGNRSSKYSKSGNTVTMSYNASPGGGSNYDYIDCGNFTMSSSSPCLVYSHKNFFTCTTYLFRLKILYVL